MEKLNELVAALYPQYGTPGSRDIDVTERRKVVVESAAAIAEAFRALEQEKEAADRYAERLNTLLDDRDATLSRYEAKLAELEMQKPRYQIQKKPSYGRESVWIDVASREEAETNVLHGYRWRMVYDAPAPAADLMPGEWTNEQCLEFLSIAFRHAEISGDIEMNDIRLAVKMANAAAPEVE